MRQSRLLFTLVGVIAAGLLAGPTSWAAPGQDYNRQTVPTNTPTPTATPLPGTILGYHTVQPGETLFCIGRAYGVDPYAIATQNVIINPNLIYPGQILAIPYAPAALPPGQVCSPQFGVATPVPPSCRWYHTVVWGENLYRIGLRYGVSYWVIAQVNNITNVHYIRTGWVLCIP
jgi:LysM repeat protein